MDPTDSPLPAPSAWTAAKMRASSPPVPSENSTRRAAPKRVHEALASGLIDRFGRRDDAWFGVDHDDG